MGRKIFVSYKYWDTNVYKVVGISNTLPKVRDYVTWLENKFNDRTPHIYKGEGDNEDLSDKSKYYIWEKLKGKIFDSSVTIVLVSPNMKEPYRWQKSQWIPWEISYSIRDIPRGGYTSRSNAVLAVILPDKYNSYLYYNVNNLFPILYDNISNGYIPVVKWNDFKYNCDYYIDKAIEAKRNVSRNKLSINL